jgi:hypothetical protein
MPYFSKTVVSANSTTRAGVTRFSIFDFGFSSAERKRRFRLSREITALFLL